MARLVLLGLLLSACVNTTATEASNDAQVDPATTSPNAASQVTGDPGNAARAGGTGERDQSGSGEAQTAPTAAATSGNTRTLVGAWADFRSARTLVLTSEGFPVLSLVARQELTLLRCGDRACTPELVTRSAPVSDKVSHANLVLDDGDSAVVAYALAGTDEIRILRCGDPMCQDFTITDPVPGVLAGWDISMQLDTEGNPVLAFYDVFELAIRVVHCNDLVCAGGVTNEVVEAGRASSLVSMVLDGDAPVFAFGDRDLELAITRCMDAGCVGESVSKSIESSRFEAMSFALAADGSPIVAIGAVGGGAEVIVCADSLCDDYARTIVDSGEQHIGGLVFPGDTGVDVSLALDSDGIPTMSYRDRDNDRLIIARCSDRRCAGAVSIERLIEADGREQGIGPTSVALDALGQPSVAFVALGFDGIGLSTQLLSCADQACAPE